MRSSVVQGLFGLGTCGYQGNQSAMIAALPGLRPGASINQGERITNVTLSGTQMAIKWTKQ
ncbi:hypothetical protein [Pseudomonas viridiflava]|uniref:hypothetical protein n=1 Tax=Pseudomonas viridiflava TaxID=33069 RepID=UPI002E9C0484|nr:hypothetical protein [Pseudomonas viridiflava]